MHSLTKTAEVLAELAAGGRIITGDRQGLLMLVDSGGSVVPAWQAALKSASKQLTATSERASLPPVALAPARAGRTYIAGPMTGLPDFNHPAFNAAAAALNAQGRTVINPADHGVVADAAWADYVRADLALLAGCETIYLLPGWARSPGALLEHHVAHSLGMRIEFADGAEVEAEGQKQADHARLNELLGNSEQLAPAIDLDQLREAFCLVLQDEFDLEAADPEDPRHDDGRDKALRVSDRLLALIGVRAGSHASDEQYADAHALVAHLASLMDDGGQGGEHWEPAKAAIAGIRAWQAGELELPDLCDMCRTRQEVRSDAEGIPFCQECWDGWQAEEAKTVQPAPAIDLERIVPPVWLSEQIGGPLDDLASGQAWRDGFNECRTRTLLMIEQAQQLALIDGQKAAPRGPDQLNLCGTCHVREEAHTDADGVPFCQRCWEEWQASEQPTKGEGVAGG